MARRIRDIAPCAVAIDATLPSHIDLVVIASERSERSNLGA